MTFLFPVDMVTDAKVRKAVLSFVTEKGEQTMNLRDLAMAASKRDTETLKQLKDM